MSICIIPMSTRTDFARQQHQLILLTMEFEEISDWRLKPRQNDWTFVLNIWGISDLVQCMDFENIFGCGKTTEHCPVNISSMIGCTQLLGLFRLKCACASRTMLSWHGKTTEHLASTSSNKTNLISSTKPFWLLLKSTEQLPTWLNKIEQDWTRWQNDSTFYAEHFSSAYSVQMSSRFVTALSWSVLRY